MAEKKSSLKNNLEVAPDPQTPSTNTVQAAISDLQKEIVDLRRKLAVSEAQVQRIQRTVRLDEREFAVGQLQSERAILNSVSQLARSVDALVNAQADGQERVDKEGQDLWLASKKRRAQGNRRKLARIEYLSKCGQEHTYLCPCGEHMGIKFATLDGKVEEENMCPRSWWLKLSWLAYEQGTLAKFNQENKLTDFIKQYTIGGSSEG